MNFLSALFRPKAAAEPPQPSVQEGFRLRRIELERRRDELKAAIEQVQAERSAFWDVHRLVLGGHVKLCGDAMMRGEQLRLQEEEFAQRLTRLRAEWNPVLDELAELTVNPHETIHREGRLVNA